MDETPENIPNKVITNTLKRPRKAIKPALPACSTTSLWLFLTNFAFPSYLVHVHLTICRYWYRPLWLLWRVHNDRLTSNADLSLWLLLRLLYLLLLLLLLCLLHQEVLLRCGARSRHHSLHTSLLPKRA